MKIKSIEKDAYFEEWKTPICYFSILDLELYGLLQTAGRTHFFFVVREGVKKKKWDIYVMTIGRNWPFRLIEESYATACIGRYFVPRPSAPRKMRIRKARLSCTWKLWGTSFIRELDLEKGLSIYLGTPREDIFEYLIQTSGEWIEIVSSAGPPQWKLMRGITIQRAIQQYLDEGY